MKVKIKSFDVDMNVKTNGIEFQIHDNADVFRGDVYLTKTGLIWCAGKTTREKGKRITWDQFIKLMEDK